MDSSPRRTITSSPLVVASAAIRSSAPRARTNRSALCARLLDRRAHDRVDQFFETNLARDGLRYLDDRREIEVFDPRPDRAGRAGRPLFLPELRIHVRRVSAPSRQLPNAGSRDEHCEDRAWQSRRTRAPGRTRLRAHRRSPRHGGARWRGPSGWPVHRDARHRARGPPGVRSPRR